MNRLIILLVLLIVLFSGAWYTYDRVTTIIANAAKLEEVAKQNQETLEKVQADSKRLQQANSELQSGLQNSEKYKDALQSKLRKHDLERLSLEKPEIIEERINNATAKVFRGLESLTAE